MKRGTQIALSAALLAAFGARLAQVHGNIDAQSGFYHAPRLWLSLPVLAALLAGGFTASHAYRKQCAASMETVEFGGTAFVLTLSTSLGAMYACARILYDIFRLHSFEHFFMTTRQLRILGFSNGAFKAEAVTALLGLAAAVWFARFALPRLKSKTGLYRNVWFALVPPAWYLVRAAVAFISEPINSNDSVKLISVAAAFSLANVWFAIAQQVSFSATESATKRLSAGAFAAAALCCCLALPDLILSVRVGAYSEAVVRVSDALSALTACYYAHRILKTAKEVPADVQP